MNSRKQETYQQLVEKRKKCSLCHGLYNPQAINPAQDVNEIGFWSSWQGSLNARIMVVGQDWADVSIYLKEGSKEDDTNPTNRNLITLFNSIGVSVKPPSLKEKNPDLFFTNAILCLKKGDKKMQEPTRKEWYQNCDRHFLKPLIELVQPQVVIALGEKATNGMLHAYSKKTFSGFLDAVEIEDGIRLSEKTRLFPVYHCGRRGVNCNRNMDEQLADWVKIERYLNAIKPLPLPVLK